MLNVSPDGSQVSLSSVNPIDPAYLVDVVTAATVEAAPDEDGNMVHNISWQSSDVVIARTAVNAWAHVGESPVPVRLPAFNIGGALRPDNQVLVLGGSRGFAGVDAPQLSFVSLPSGEMLGTMDFGPKVNGGEVRGFDFSPDGERLLVTLGDGRALVVDPVRQTVIDEVTPDSDGRGGISTLGYSADGTLLATRDLSGSIDIRDPESLDVRYSLVGGVTTSELLSFGPEFSPDSRYLLTTEEQRPRLWDLEARIPIGTFPSDEGMVPGTSVGEDQLNLVTSLGEYALVWNLRMDEWSEIACRAAGRNLTQGEWDQFGPEGEPYRATCTEWPALGT